MVSMSDGARGTGKFRCGSSSRPVSLLPFLGCGTAGIDPETGKPLYSFTIITTHANAVLRRIHDRMPVMYRRDMGRQWLEESISGELELSLVTQSVLSEDLEAYEVSTLVNSPDNDSPNCLRRVSPKVNQPRQMHITYPHRK